MEKKIIGVLLCVAMTSTLMAGCGSSSDDSSTEEETTEEETTEEETTEEEYDIDGNLSVDGAKSGGVLKLGTAQNPSVVGYTPEISNNSFIQYLRCAYESLLYYDEEGNIIGQLATDWSVDAENATLSFSLMEDVQFSDGTEFNADAVKWNIEKYQEAERSEVNYVDNINIVDDYNIEIQLTEWNSSALEQIGFFIYYMSPTAYDENGIEWMRVNSAGTGPFVVSDFEQGVSVEYVKNENYHIDGEPYLDGIKFTIFADDTTLENSLIAGEIDVATYAGIDLRHDIEGNTTYIEEQNSNGQGVESTGLIPSSANEDDPFYDANVRKALCYAVDWDTLVSSLSYGLYERTNQWAMPGSVTYSPDVVGYDYDPEKAKELLADAGYEDGFETTLYIVGSTGFYANMGVAIADYLSEVGITANIETIDSAKSTDLMNNGWEGLYWHWASIGPDLGLYMGRHLDYNGAYYADGIQHPDDAMELLEDIRKATTDEEKIELEWEMQELIYDEYCLFGEPLFVNTAVWVRNIYVKGGYFGTAHAASWSPETCWLDE